MDFEGVVLPALQKYLKKRKKQAKIFISINVFGDKYRKQDCQGMHGQLGSMTTFKNARGVDVSFY